MTNRPSYPSREPFFANRFVRLLLEATVANELGAEAFALLVTVALTEDAKRYRGPVTFFNGQLLTFIGVKSEQSLISIRRRAVEAGWLHYAPGAKNVAGRYWVTVPPGYEDGADAHAGKSAEETATDEVPKPDGALGSPPDALQNLEPKRNDGEVEPERGGGHSSLPLTPPPPLRRRRAGGRRSRTPASRGKRHGPRPPASPGRRTRSSTRSPRCARPTPSPTAG